MKKIVFVIALCLSFAMAYAQESNKRESNFHLGVDLQTKYIWRGMEMMTNDAAPVIFPCINYSNNGFYAYAMGGYSINGKYAEVDLGLSYSYKWLTVALNDYYYPTTNTAEDNYFNLKNKETGRFTFLPNTASIG